MHNVLRSLQVWTLAALLIPCAAQAAAPSSDTASQPRAVVVISDLHMGLGRTADGAWHSTEDFRWPYALAGFLEAISQRHGDRIDLLIAGDFLELWQPPAHIQCAGPQSSGPQPEAGQAPDKEPFCAGRHASGEAKNYGCTVDQVQEITEVVVAAHRAELKALADFAARGDNRLVIIPGNHDAALVLDPVWEIVAGELRRSGGRVEREADGVWVSDDGRVITEHGHQMAWEANKYPDWPRITRVFGGQEYVRQPWGERFVQCLYNREEGNYPLIDNLSPSSAGARYRMAEEGFWGSAADVARFLYFNLADTSLRQKIQILGPENEPAPPRWDLEKARKLGYRLFTASLEAEDPLAAALEGEAQQWADARAELDALAASLSDEEIASLCDLLAVRGSEISCEPSTLSHGLNRVLRSRERRVKAHLKERYEEHRRMIAFVYGHTHAFEVPWGVTLSPVKQVQVANSGAFQRLVDDDQLQQLARSRGLSPGELLRQGTLEELPACYTFVEVLWQNGRPIQRLGAWKMEELAASGSFVDPCGPHCPNVGHGCDSQ